jgi:arsenite methyltransferase
MEPNSPSRHQSGGQIMVQTVAKLSDDLDGAAAGAAPAGDVFARGELMSEFVKIDLGTLREQVRQKYRQVATMPAGKYHFHTGRFLAARLAYDATVVAQLPDVAVESFAGVANPFSLGALEPGGRVVDIGSGGGFDSFIAARQVGAEGQVIGVDMTEEMVRKSRSTAALLGLSNVEFRAGYAENLPLEGQWADVVLSNGVINLCADKRRIFAEIFRVLRPGGRLQFADIANGKPVPEAVSGNIDLWTA